VISRTFLPRLHLLVAVLGVPLFLWAYQGQWRLAGLPVSVDPHEFRYPAAVNGIAAGAPVEVQLLVQGYPPGVAIELREFGAASRPVTLIRARTLAYRLITLGSGLGFLAVCLLVLAPRTETAFGRDFFWCTFLYGMAVVTDGVFFPRGPAGELRNLVQITSLAVLPTLFVHLTLAFPGRNRILDRARWFMPLLWTTAIALIVWQTAALHAYVHDPGLEAGAALRVPKRTADVALVAQVALALGFLLHSWRTVEGSRQRRQIKWLLWGFTIGVTPYVFLRTLPGLVGIAPPWDPAFDRVLELAIPVAFMGAVARHQFLDIDIIIRRSVLYAGIAAVLVLVYVGVAGVFGSRVEAPPGTTGWLLLGMGVAAGLAFQPLRRLIGRAVDRTLFGIAQNHERALLGLEQRLDQADDQRALAAVLHQFLMETVGPRACVVSVAERGGWVTVPPEESVVDLVSPQDPATLEFAAAPNATDSAESEGGMPRSESGSAPYVLLEPLRLDGATAGLVLLGPKRNERRYVDSDLKLLRAAAGEGARALERLRLVQNAAEEAAARRRLDDMNRLKNEFLARVAHDLRTPLASITWSVDNLLDGVTGELAAPQREYLDSVRASAGHLNRLITNLLEITRMERDGLRVADQQVDLVEVVRRTAATARPLAEEKGVKLVIDAPAAGVPARGDGDKLVESVLNLLDNAIKYAPPGTTVDVTCGVVDGKPTITVRDRGAGLGGALSSALFARFAQGAPSPHSQKQGFGLGLYIVDSYLRLMGGEVRAADHPEGGAMFTCLLRPPAAPAPPEERA